MPPSQKPGPPSRPAPGRPPTLRSRLRTHRILKAWTQTRLAGLAGISRQAYGAIERGESVPSVEVALRLSRALGVPLEEVFALAGGEAGTEAEIHPWGPEVTPGRRVRVASVGARRIAFPAEGPGFPEPEPARGVVEERSDVGLRVRSLPGGGAEPTLVLCGCDPASQLLRRAFPGEEAVTWIPAGSRQALLAVAEGRTHVAGFHLEGEGGSPRNVSPEPSAPSDLPFPATVVGFAVWQQGLLVRHDNPLGIRSVEDLARPGVRLLNREPGSGSRILLDRLMEEAGIPGSSVAGYGESAAAGHWAVAEGVAAGAADVGVGILAAARAFGLGWIPLREERYDLVIPDHFLDDPGIGALLDLLRRPWFQAQVESLGGYDVSPMGKST
jgi:putative molybdopterin biosynthesis protein